jgi:hypothetical protein
MEFPRSDDPEQRSHIQRDVIILVVIVGLLCCCFIALGAGGYYFYEQQSAMQAQAATATSAYMATKIKQDTEAEATRQAEASATAQALAIQATATAAQLQVNATATAAEFQARVSATAIAKEAELRTYQYFDPFDANNNDWREGDEDNDFWTGNISIKNDVYVWQVDEVKEAFVAWSDFQKADVLKNFDLVVLARRVQGKPENICYGVIFRKSPDGFDSGAYLLSVCEHGYFIINYYSEETGWENIEDWTETDLIYPDNWNQIEIRARGKTFDIFINNQPLVSFEDDRLAEGYVSLFIDNYELEAAEIWFDNFALQPRE